MTVTIAFSKAARVMTSRGLRSCSRRRRTARPARKHSSSFPPSSAGVEDEYGRLIPRASIAQAIVFAVYIPPQAPAPGQLSWMMVFRSSAVIRPARNSPYDCAASTMSRACSSPPKRVQPGLIVPP